MIIIRWDRETEVGSELIWKCACGNTALALISKVAAVAVVSAWAVPYQTNKQCHIPDISQETLATAKRSLHHTVPKSRQLQLSAMGDQSLLGIQENNRLRFCKAGWLLVPRCTLWTAGMRLILKTTVSLKLFLLPMHCMRVDYITS